MRKFNETNTKITAVTITALLIFLVGLWFVFFQIPDMQMRTIDDRTIDNIDFYEKTTSQIISNFDTLKIQYKKKYETAYLDCIAVITDQDFLKANKQKYFYIDSLLTSKLTYPIYINADSSIYFKTQDYINSCYGKKVTLIFSVSPNIIRLLI